MYLGKHLREGKVQMPKLLPLSFVTSRFMPDLIVCIASDGIQQITRAVNCGADFVPTQELISLISLPPSDSGSPECHRTEAIPGFSAR